MIYVREGWIAVWHVMDGTRTRCGLRPLETDCRCTERPVHVCAACDEEEEQDAKDRCSITFCPSVKAAIRNQTI